MLKFKEQVEEMASELSELEHKRKLADESYERKIEELTTTAQNLEDTIETNKSTFNAKMATF